MFSAIDSPISLAFLTRYPSPADARGMGEKRLAALLKAHHHVNRKSPSQPLDRLRSAPPGGRAGKIETRRRRSIVLALIRTLQVMRETILAIKTRRRNRARRSSELA